MLEEDGTSPIEAYVYCFGTSIMWFLNCAFVFCLGRIEVNLLLGA